MKNKILLLEIYTDNKIE